MAGFKKGSEQATAPAETGDDARVTNGELFGLNGADAQPAEATTAAADAQPAEATAAPKVGSIVPSKYGNKYRNGGSDELATFINDQCKNKDGDFEYTAFFELCRKNGLPEEKVAHYQTQIADNRHGAPGRARMTLRNMLATIARKNGKLVGLNGAETPIDIPKPAVSGAAAKTAGQSAEAAAPTTGAEGAAA